MQTAANSFFIILSLMSRTSAALALPALSTDYSYEDLVQWAIIASTGPLQKVIACPPFRLC
jgi:hypothetical protein